MLLMIGGAIFAIFTAVCGAYAWTHIDETQARQFVNLYPWSLGPLAGMIIMFIGWILLGKEYW